MRARYFVDENDLALGKALAQRYGDVVYPGHAALPLVPRGSLDDDWLPIIGREGLVVITRDQRIRRRPVERHLWNEHQVRGFVLTGRKSQSTEASLAILGRHWAQIAELVVAGPEGPWMYAVTDERIREIGLA